MHPAPTEFDKLLGLVRRLVSRYQAAGQGELIVQVKKSPNNGTKEIFSTFVPCTRYFSFIRNDWEKYCSRQCLPIAGDPFDCLKTSVLKILEDTGHGEVHMKFEVKRGHPQFTYRVTTSHQNRLPPT